DIIYLWKGQYEKLTYELSTIGELDASVSWKTDNEKIATVDNDGNVTGVDYGETYVRAVSSEGKSKAVKVIVTNLIRKPAIDFNKNYIKCNQFSVYEADMIDQILFDRIDTAGYQTRAGVIAAARFLALEFSYRIPYFAENGRLNNYAPYKHVDGEGRYYHRGLYLNENKFSSITSSFVGPCIWGCDLQTFTELPEFTYGKYYPNGLDCSGFVSWALLNGGFDIGDIGAGENDDHDDLDDLGTKVYITDELMSSGRVKVGDLIGLNGHMAILVGWDDNNYYIAESLNNTGGVVITTVARNKLVHNSIYKYIILMDEVYKSDGNYTNMW
ncbi:MAG: Ig-like domain-containing protein, partial [Bacilli bacterium]|nr:Ig-like domain-containing protein [Bacilli bacterium]